MFLLSGSDKDGVVASHSLDFYGGLKIWLMTALQTQILEAHQQK